MTRWLKSKLMIFISAFIFGQFALAAEDTPDSIMGTIKVTAEKLFELVDDFDDLVIIDARKTEDREKGYIEGSLGIPDTDMNPAVLAKHLATKKTPVIFYCNGPKCGRSVKSSKMAVAEGYKNIYWFRGGWEEWSNKGLPVTKD
ncbi:MAG: rhodanese-like domain-containing protein [Pseudomonadales bacterium]|nr:rhodanese-like domain-containing protein [Pseudomonadales bacterium]